MIYIDVPNDDISQVSVHISYLYNDYLINDYQKLGISSRLQDFRFGLL